MTKIEIKKTSKTARVFEALGDLFAISAWLSLFS